MANRIREFRRRRRPPVDLDFLTAQLAREGWYVWLRFDGKLWQAEIRAGVDRWPANQPQPYGSAQTSLAAVQAAVKMRDETKVRG